MRTVKYNPHPEQFISVTHYEFEFDPYLLTVTLQRNRLTTIALGLEYNHTLQDFGIMLLWFGITINIMKRP